MENANKVIKANEERNELIKLLADELPVLRAKLDVSQAELSNMIAISRQTYSSIETKRRKMSWSIFLSLIFVFDNNVQTHNYIREIGAFPQFLIRDNKCYEGSELFAANRSIYNSLDDQATELKRSEEA